MEVLVKCEAGGWGCDGLYTVLTFEYLNACALGLTAVFVDLFPPDLLVGAAAFEKVFDIIGLQFIECCLRRISATVYATLYSTATLLMRPLDIYIG